MGATLWTDYRTGAPTQEIGQFRAGPAIADHRTIVKGERFFSPRDAAALHDQHRRFLTTALSKPRAGRNLVVTHHLPSELSIDPRFAHSPLNCAFASNLDNLVSDAHLWIHGHSHASADYRIGGCRVVCNPAGYPSLRGQRENGRFDPALIIDL